MDARIISRTRSEVEGLSSHLGLDIEQATIRGQRYDYFDLGDFKIVLSIKEDVYYTCSKDECSCPSWHFGNRPCKHQAALFKEQPKPREDARPVMSLRETIWAAEQEDLARSRARGVA